MVNAVNLVESDTSSSFKLWHRSPEDDDRVKTGPPGLFTVSICSPRVLRCESRRASLFPEKQSLSMLGLTPEGQTWDSQFAHEDSFRSDITSELSIPVTTASTPAMVRPVHPMFNSWNWYCRHQSLAVNMLQKKVAQNPSKTWIIGQEARRLVTSGPVRPWVPPRWSTYVLLWH